MTEITCTCKSYATYSILFQGHFYTVNTHYMSKLNLCRNATGLPGEILKGSSV